MRNKLKFGFFIFLLSVGAFAQKTSNDKPLFKLGVSQINITPGEPVLMSGYSERKTPFTEILDSLYASALYFTGEKTQALLITADLIEFPADFVDDTKKMISAKIGIPSDNILIIAVHNHGGPALKAFDNIESEATNAYGMSVQEKLVQVSVVASKKAVPYRIGIGKGSCNMNMNRRALFAEGYIGLGRNPDGPCDHELDVVKFEDMSNNLIAVLINWPCHGTVSGKENYKITGDWPGAAARFIKKQIGKNVVVAVTAGASADICPIYGPASRYFEIDAMGYHVANEACKTLAQISAIPVKSLQTSYSKISFPGKKTSESYYPATSYEKGPDTELRLSGLKIGDLMLEGISGELMTEIGMEVKKQSPYTNTIIVTHCNGASGYICTDKSYPEGGYEVRVSTLMPGVEKPLIQKFIEQIHSF